MSGQSDPSVGSRTCTGGLARRVLMSIVLYPNVNMQGAAGAVHSVKVGVMRHMRSLPPRLREAAGEWHAADSTEG